MFAALPDFLAGIGGLCLHLSDGTALLPELPNHKLNTMCNHLGIPLDHHRAGSDSRACGALLLHYLRCGMDVAPFIRRYDLLRARTISKHVVGRGV